jgi:hypothetical protein
MALVQRGESVSENDLYSKAGLNTMLAWKDRPPTFQAAARQKLPWHYHLDSRRGPLSDELKTYLNSLLTAHSNGQGILLWDEPKLPEFADLGKIAAWLRETHPELLVYSNLNPIPAVGDPRFAPGRAGLKEDGNESYPYSYEDSIQDYLKIVQPDLLMTDIYPFWHPDKLDPSNYLLQKYFLNLAQIREAALAADIPYWMFVQSYEDKGRCRYPSDSELRMQVFSTLAFGFTGIAYFTYDMMEEGGMLDTTHRPTDMYDRVSKLNPEVTNLGKTLRFLTNTNILYVPGTQPSDGKQRTNPIPLGVEAFRSGSWNATMITDVEIDKQGPDRNALLGFFEDDDGGLYLMVVNLSHGENTSAEKVVVSLTLSFNPTVKSLSILSRKTGRPEGLQLNDGKVTLQIPGGTGELLKLNDGKFPGL